MAEVIAHSLFSKFDINLFKSGKHYRLYEKFGSHITTLDGVEGTYFAVVTLVDEVGLETVYYAEIVLGPDCDIDVTEGW